MSGLLLEFQQLPLKDQRRLVLGETDKLESRVSEQLQEVAATARSVVDELRAAIDEFLAELTPAKQAELRGYMEGLVLYELLEGIAVGAVFAGAAVALFNSSDMKEKLSYDYFGIRILADFREPLDLVDFLLMASVLVNRRVGLSVGWGNPGGLCL